MAIVKGLTLLLILLLSTNSYAYQQIEFIGEIGTTEKKTKQRQFNAPRAIALAGEKIYIADTEAHRVIVLDGEGKTILAWGTKGDKPGQLRSPAGIAVDEEGMVYVADTGNHRIRIFDPEGRPAGGFGAKGGGPREFDSPAGICVHRSLLYVADTGNSRVQVLSRDGIFIKQITLMTKKDELKAPVSVAVDGQNKIHVLDSDANRVRIFDHDGNLLRQFGGKGRGTDGFNAPLGLALDGAGAVYVADTGNYKLKKFDSEGKLLGSLGSEGDGPGQFREATGLAVDRDGKAFVLDAGRHMLQVFAFEPGGAKPLSPLSPPVSVQLSKTISGEVNGLTVDKRAWALAGDSIIALGVHAGRTIGSRGSEPAMFKNPRGLTVDPSGKFWVADTGNDRLQKFSIEGNLLHVIGKSGSGEGEFRSPSAVAISRKGKIYVADTGNRRVQAFTSKGMFLGMFGKAGKLAGQFSEPVDLAVDEGEHVYVVDRDSARISKFDGNGTLVWEKGKAGSLEGEFDEPANIVVSPDNEIYVLDSGNGRVQVFDGDGNFLRAFGNVGTGPGEFKAPLGMALEAGVRLYVGDRGNGRVQVFTLRQTPGVPKDVTTQARPNEIQLNWKSNSESYLERYNVYRADSADGPFKFLGSSTDPFYMDKGLPSNKTYFYRVASAAREGNESAFSTPVSAGTPKLVPGAPKKVRVEAIEKQITLSWLPNLEPFVAHYRIHRAKQLSAGFETIAKTDRTVFVDGPLADETYYYYQVTAVSREGDESPASDVVFTTTPKAALTLPPLEITKVEVAPIFASAYKHYESHPLGAVVIRNNTENVYPKIKLTFSIKDFMDYPTEIEIEQVPAGKEAEVRLKPVFNNKILDVTENTPMQSELALTYYVGGDAKTVTRSFPVTLYERHAMVWDQKAKLGAFVTPKDPPVADFSRQTILPYVEAYPNLHQSIVYARALYSALGVLGLKYIVDPTSPFQEFSESSASVDYLQYPRDTLARKSGDCDDLSVLFASTLENIGVGTAFIDVPGHVFVMFNTGVPEKDKATLGFPDLLVVHEGTAWVPVEMTMVGSSFTRAWQKAAEEYREWSAKGKAEVVNTQKSWEQFKPATLPSSEARAAKVTKEQIEGMFKDELETLGRQRLAALSAEYLDVLKKQPNNIPALGQLGILYGENGLYAEALEQFQKILVTDKKNSPALNNIGNINLLQERLEDAKIAYEASLEADPDDTGTMANLARVLLRMGKKEEARTLFQKAAVLDPRVLRRSPDVAEGLGVSK